MHEQVFDPKSKSVLKSASGWQYNSSSPNTRVYFYAISIYFGLSNTLPETNIAPEKCWLEDDRFLLG